MLKPISDLVTVTALIPTHPVSAGATLITATGESDNFSGPVVYKLPPCRA